MAQDKPLISGEMRLDGKLITNVDPSQIGPNFQELKNLRYTDTNPKGIKGMTKINTTALSSHPKIRNGFHFKKDQPSESHVLVQAFNSGETESKIYENTTAIPSAGDFSATTLHTDDSAAGTGRFSKAASGNVAYCNGKESLIWGGNEHFSSGFVNYDPDGSWTNDFTEKVQNIRTDSDNIATLTKVDGSIPANTGLLLHLDNNVTDSSSTGHTVTNNNVTFTTTSKFGTHAATFNGTDAYLSVPDHADFDFSGGNFCVEMQVKITNLKACALYSQSTDVNNSMLISLTAGGSIQLSVYVTGTNDAHIKGSVVLETGIFYHIAIVESGDHYYMFLDGSLIGYTKTTARPLNYTGAAYIGAWDSGGLTYFFDGVIDEVRVGKASTFTDYFDTREVPYGTSAAYVNIGSVRPLDSAKFSVGTANTTASSVNVLFWKNIETSSGIKADSGKWTDCTSIVDGTASGGNSLAQNGSIAFDSTVADAKPKIYNNTYLYWYKFVFTDIDDTTTVSNVTTSMPMQTIRDLWDGEIRNPVYFEVNTGSQAYDNTINVFEGTYDSANSATYSDLSAHPSAGHLLVGFVERMTGLDIRMITNRVNNVNLITRIYSWSDEQDDGFWKRLSIINDGTYDNTSPLGRSGIIAWHAPNKQDDLKQVLSGKPPLYYYKLEFTLTVHNTTASVPPLKTGTDAVNVYYIGGIPAQRQIDGYKFPLLSHDRLMLCSNQDNKKNSILIFGRNSNSIANGVSSREIPFGNDDELIAGAELYGELESNLYKMTIFCKLTETWLLNELRDENFEYYRVSDEIGCVAPLTMTQVHIPSILEGNALHGAIWRSTDAIYFYDGREFEPIHRDIEDVFDNINTSMISREVGFLDPVNDEWHWLIATGASTVLNEEWVYDLKRRRWYQTDRTTDLNCGFPVVDTNGQSYTYGCIDTGYMERLENGSTFDGQDRVFTLHTGEYPLAGSMMYQTKLRKFKLISKSQTTTNSIAVTHYGDGNTTGTSMPSLDSGETGKRISSQTKSTNQHDSSVFHSLKFVLTNNTDTNGFEPLYIGTFRKDIREER